MGFAGWSESAITFYAGLEADNSKEYWTAHKETYEVEVKAPMLAMLSDLADEFGEGRLFRPYRDTRFSADKTPYKTAAAATVGEHGYVSISADGLMVGCGLYHLAGEQLARYRGAVDAESSGVELDEILSRQRNFGNEVVGVDPLKTVPRGFAKDHPRATLLSYKGLVTMKRWEPKPWLAKPGAKDRVAAFLTTAAPLSEWLTKHVGEETS